ncbi:hypothetical protein D3C80_1303800 [compost metagenome]
MYLLDKKDTVIVGNEVRHPYPFEEKAVGAPVGLQRTKRNQRLQRLPLLVT